MLPLAQLPGGIQELLQEYVDMPMQEVDVRVEQVQLEARVPASMARYGLKRVIGKYRGRANNSSLKVVGATIGDIIYIHPDYAEWETAAGLALLAHEIRHVEQQQTIPNFLSLYQAEDAVTPSDRPWENRYEYEAYLRECQVWHDLIRKGYPRGSWVPLGAQVGICTN
jgi:Domain of unknown function (DUF4157)